MALTHISQPLNEILNRIKELIEKNDEITKNQEEKQKTLLNEDEVATIFSIPVDRLKILRYRGKGPHFYKMGGTIRYKHDDVMDYLESVKIK